LTTLPHLVSEHGQLTSDNHAANAPPAASARSGPAARDSRGFRCYNANVPHDRGEVTSMADRSAETTWNGDLMSGSGTLSTKSSGVLKDTPVTWAARTESPEGKTSPEEMLAAAHASCYAMAFSAGLGRGGSPPERLHVTATATFERAEQGFKVSRMRLDVSGRVPGMDQAKFEEAARAAEQACPVSNALRNNVEISVNATLE
jgi:lipoyl-dependent peroxiredoxin